jgi:hypothetical protein
MNKIEHDFIAKPYPPLHKKKPARQAKKQAIKSHLNSTNTEKSDLLLKDFIEDSTPLTLNSPNICEFLFHHQSLCVYPVLLSEADRICHQIACAHLNLSSPSFSFFTHEISNFFQKMHEVRFHDKINETSDRTIKEEKE